MGVIRRSALAVLVLFAGCEADRPSAPASRAGTITVDAADIWYRSIGEGRPVVAVHGGPGLDHGYLVPWLEPIGESNQLILYDQRGLGASSTPLDSASVTMTKFLDDIDAIRDRVAGTDRITLMAHSWGAIPALLYAMRWPARLESLILLNPVEPGQRFAEEAAEAQNARRSPVDAAAIDSLVATTAFREGDRATRNRVFFHVFRGTFADPAVADTAFHPDLAARTAVQGPLVATLLMTPLAGLDFWAQLPLLDVPVLIVHGEEDPIPLAMVREMADSLPRATLVTISGAGHFPFVERQAETLDAIAAFLAELPPIP